MEFVFAVFAGLFVYVIMAGMASGMQEWYRQKRITDELEKKRLSRLIVYHRPETKR